MLTLEPLRFSPSVAVLIRVRKFDPSHMPVPDSLAFRFVEFDLADMCNVPDSDLIKEIAQLCASDKNHERGKNNSQLVVAELESDAVHPTPIQCEFFGGARERDVLCTLDW